MDPISLIPQIDPSIKSALETPRPVSPQKTEKTSEAPAHLPSEDQLTQAAFHIENQLANQDLRLHFSMSENGNRIIIQVIDEKKGEVIRTVPPDQFFKTAMSGNNLGLMVDQSG
jgi:uncharacterized FlaG/YvyC family protein